MKLHTVKKSAKKIHKSHTIDDLRYLQKRISGKSVYKPVRILYERYPKHKRRSYRPW